MTHTNRAVPRRTVLAGTAALTALLPTPHAEAHDNPDPGALGRHAHRARQTYDALQRYFHDPDTGLYLETHPRTGDNPWSYVWPFSQALLATQTLAAVRGHHDRYTTDLDDRYQALESYWNATTDPPGYDSYLRPPLGHGGDKFYDDNEWIALALLQRHYLTPGGDMAAISRAKEIFDLVVYGWDTDPTHPCPGGVFWTQAPWSRDRNTVSNAPGAQLGLHLHLLTGERHYLDWALRMYEWVRGCLLAPNGLYWDSIRLDGSIWKAQFSYNQGTMIGAGVLLYRATGERRYLRQAEDTAERALTFYATNNRYFSQPARFHAIFFANLLQLAALRPDSRYRRAMLDYAGTARSRVHDARSGLYRFTGDEPVLLLEQAGMTRIEAMLAWHPHDYPLLT